MAFTNRIIHESAHTESKCTTLQVNQPSKLRDQVHEILLRGRNDWLPAQSCQSHSQAVRPSTGAVTVGKQPPANQKPSTKLGQEITGRRGRKKWMKKNRRWRFCIAWLFCGGESMMNNTGLWLAFMLIANERESFLSCWFLLKGPCHSGVTEGNVRFTWTQRKHHHITIKYQHSVIVWKWSAGYGTDIETVTDKLHYV